jgi:hypothetical protein
MKTWRKSGKAWRKSGRFYGGKAADIYILTAPLKLMVKDPENLSLR